MVRTRDVLARIVFAAFLVVASVIAASSREQDRNDGFAPADLVTTEVKEADQAPEVRVGARDGIRTYGLVRFVSCPGSPPRRLHTRRGWADLHVWDWHPAILEKLVQAVAREESLGPPREPATCAPPSRWPREIAEAALVTALVAALIGAARRARVAFEVRLPHFVPAFIQLSIYAYWSLYWPGVADHMGSVALQIGLAYALEAGLSFARFRQWRVGLGPMPVVLSANLFAWFDPVGSIVVVSAAIASKVLLRRGGKHVLNPSAAGLVAGGLYAWLWPTSAWGGLFHLQGVAPNIVEVILLLGMFPLLRFGLGLVPLGGLMALMLIPLPRPNVTQAGMIIALSLFASDPATTPKNQSGRLLYGFFIGTGVVAASLVMTALGHPDDFSKVLPVTIANVLAPWFDTLGAKLEDRARWSRILAPRHNAAFAALWFVLVAGRLAGHKRIQFEAALHWTYGTPLVVRGADDVPRCSDNPVFCRPFTFVSEVGAWAARGSSGR